MRIRTRGITIEIDLVREVVDVGELVKFAVQWGWSAVVEPADKSAGEEGGHVVRLSSTGRNWAEIDFTSMAMIYGYAKSRSGEQVLADIRKGFEDRHFPLDRPIQDVMSIGGGPDHEGHD